MHTPQTLMLALIMTMSSSVAMAFNFDSGDPAKGKEAFISLCRTCHDGSQAKNLSPAHKTKRQWYRYFDKDFKKLKRKMPNWDSFGYSQELLENVYRYVVEHALDSDKPQTCD